MEHSGAVSGEIVFLFGVRPSVETELLRLVRADVLVPTVSVMTYNRALFLQQKQQKELKSEHSVLYHCTC